MGLHGLIAFPSYIAPPSLYSQSLLTPDRLIPITFLLPYIDVQADVVSIFSLLEWLLLPPMGLIRQRLSRLSP